MMKPDNPCIKNVVFLTSFKRKQLPPISWAASTFGAKKHGDKVIFFSDEHFLYFKMIQRTCSCVSFNPLGPMIHGSCIFNELQVSLDS